MGTILVNGQKVAEGRVEHTQCCIFSADEGADVGADEGTPVTEEYKAPFKFTGNLKKVVIDLTPENLTAEDDQKLKEGKAAIGVAQ